MVVLYGLFWRSRHPSAELAALQQIGGLIASDQHLHVLVALLRVDGDIATLSLELSECKYSVLNRLLLALSSMPTEDKIRKLTNSTQRLQ